METLAFTLLISFSLLGFFLIFFTTFGTFFIFLGAAFFAVLTEFQIIDVPTLLWIFLLYIVGEVMEYGMVIIGAKKWGASNWAVLGAVLGGIVGAILGSLGLGVGLILGTFGGIFMGAFSVELLIHRDLMKSLKAGAGSLLGRIGSVFVKVIISFFIFAILAIKIFGTL